MLPRTIICWFLLTLSFPTVSGQVPVDSLLAVVARPSNDTADLYALHRLSTETYRDDLPRAMAWAFQMARLGDARQLPRWSAMAYRTIGVLHDLSSRIDSFSYYNALAMSRLGDPAASPEVGVGLLINQGAIATVQFRLDDAVGDYAAAYDLAIKSRHTKHIPKLLNNLGVVYRRLGRFHSAERTYHRSLALKEASADSLGIANTLHNLGRVEIKLGKVEIGLATLDRSASLFIALDMPEEVPSVNISRGVGFFDKGDLDRAETYVQEAMDTPDLVLDDYTRANALLCLGAIAFQTQRYELAREHLEQGLPLAEATNVLFLKTDYNRWLGRTYGKLKQPERAYQHFAFYTDNIQEVFAQEQLEVHGETSAKFESQLREAEIERQQLIIAQQRQRQQLLGLGLGFLALLSIVTFLLLRTRLKFQRSEALRLETQRKAEIKVLHREAEVSGLRAMIEGQETERQRVAKDLHDGLGGLLATVKARLSREAPTAATTNQLLDRACSEVRRIAHNMMPQTLALSGLTGSVQDIVTQLNQRGLDTDLEIIGQPDLRLDEESQAMLLRILQELTHNVVKHARATKLFIQLLDQPDQLLLTVEDNGVGFNADYARTQVGGIGLANIENRVTYLRGDIQYDGSPGHGTTVTLTVPL
jgi:signal transduction histidine kinase